MTPSTTHLVLIPSYNTGPIVFRTVAEACIHWNPVWVMIDGSTDGTCEELSRRQSEFPGLKVLVIARNGGKGAAILHGLRHAIAAGFTHVLTMDSDGQHPAVLIPRFMAASADNPRALVLGVPVFDETAPMLRVRGRRISNWWANLETLWAGIGDSLFGFRVYPAANLVAVMLRNRWMHRFDFDPEAAVRLAWRGLPIINLPADVRYPSAAEGGVSHFHYGRDNLLLSWMHLRLFGGFLWRLPGMLRNKIGV